MGDINAEWMHHMDHLKDSVNVVLEAIPPGSKVCYLDYPVYNNIGDILIMLGTERFFHQNRINVIARYSVNDCPERLDLPENTIIAFQGGGNFGDLYSEHQNLRERIARTHTQHRIVILPQTIFYTPSADMSAVESSIGEHPDMHIFTRDMESILRISKHAPNAEIKLCPDMAHYLWSKYFGLVSVSWAGLPKTPSTLALIRRDRESIGSGNEIFSSKDWEDVISVWDGRFMKAFRIVQQKRIFPSRLMSRVWIEFSKRVVRKAVRLYKRYEVIETSRLHGHILACLTGRPSTFHDNSYGKNSSYWKTWTHDLPESRLVKDIPNVLNMPELAVVKR